MDHFSLEHHSTILNGVRLHYVTAGQGAPLYLLHGYPQSWYMWRKMIPLLAGRHRLVMPDLRGYGDSDKPLDGYDKRTLAADIRALADHLGDSRFGLVGHDRGARVAHRYALDHGETLTGVAVLDIIPTATVFERVNREVALSTWHWFFLPVPDLAEKLIAAEPEAVLRYFFRGWSADPGAIEEEAVAEYLRCFRIPGTIRATCADYRAGASTDLEQDAADAHLRVEAPLLALWGEFGKLHHQHPLKTWQEKATQVTGEALPCGHFLPEEAPQAVAERVLAFFEGRQ